MIEFSCAPGCLDCYFKEEKMGLTSGEKEDYLIEIFISRGFRLISALALSLALVSFSKAAEARVPANVPPPIKIAEKSPSSFLAKALSHMVARVGYLYIPQTMQANQVGFAEKNTQELYTQLPTASPWYIDSSQGLNFDLGVRVAFFYIGAEQSSLTMKNREKTFTAESETFSPEFPFPTVNIEARTTSLKLGLMPHLGSGVYLLVFVSWPIRNQFLSHSYNSEFYETYRSHEHNSWGYDNDEMPFWYQIKLSPYENTTLKGKASLSYGAEVMIRTLWLIKLGAFVRYTPSLSWWVLDWEYKVSPLVIGARVGL